MTDYTPEQLRELARNRRYGVQFDGIAEVIDAAAAAQEELSEQVSDEMDPSVNAPWMRCSPDLPRYIAALGGEKP